MRDIFLCEKYRTHIRAEKGLDRTDYAIVGNYSSFKTTFIMFRIWFAHLISEIYLCNRFAENVTADTLVNIYRFWKKKLAISRLAFTVSR